MAYPNNFYNPYQPMYQPPMTDQLTQLRNGQYPGPMPVQQPAAQAAPASSGGIVWVQGEAAARAYMVAAGNSVMLMDSDAERFYIKSTDASGMPQPLRIFDYKERTTAPKTPSAAPQNQDVEFVTREEFEALRAKFEALTAKPVKKAKEETENG